MNYDLKSYQFIGSLAYSVDYCISTNEEGKWMLKDKSWDNRITLHVKSYYFVLVDLNYHLYNLSIELHCVCRVTILLQWRAVLLLGSYLWRSLRWSLSTICLWGQCLELWGWASACRSCSSWTRTSQLLSWMLHKTSKQKKHQLYIPNNYCCINIIWK